MATLAAYDIAKAVRDLPIKVHVTNYTFGAPRVGNHAFANDYNEVVPDTWSIINDQDLVARQAKFFTWYKRPGQRVLINTNGDLLVRPTYVENSTSADMGGLFSSSVSHHLLLSYRTSLAAVVKAQLDRRKRLHVRALLRECMRVYDILPIAVVLLCHHGMSCHIMCTLSGAVQLPENLIFCAASVRSTCKQTSSSHYEGGMCTALIARLLQNSLSAIRPAGCSLMWVCNCREGCRAC